MSGCVTVTGPPRAICALNFGTTEPTEPSTLPKRTAMSRVGRRGRMNSASSACAVHLGEALGRAEHRDRLDGLVGGDHHDGAGARLDRRVGDVHGAEHVGLDALGPVLLEIGHVLQRRGVEDHVGAKVAHHLAHALAVAHIGDHAVDLRVARQEGRVFENMMQRRFGAFEDQQIAGAERRPRGCRFPSRSSRRRR